MGAYAPPPELLAEAERLALRGRGRATGLRTGLHRSRRQGCAIEFSEHRVYSPGDDVRQIDWRAFAKRDRLFIKQCEDETQLRVELAVDCSGSMGFAHGRVPRKLDRARDLAAACAHVALRQGDAAGVAGFAATPGAGVPARSGSGHLAALLACLASMAPHGSTATAAGLDALAGRRGGRSRVIVLTDLLDPDPNLLPAFARLVARRHDVSVAHVLDRAELTFPYEDAATFAAMEDGRTAPLAPRSVRARYCADFAQRLEELRRTLVATGVHYVRTVTDAPAGPALAQLLMPSAAPRT